MLRMPCIAHDGPGRRAERRNLVQGVCPCNAQVRTRTRRSLMPCFVDEDNQSALSVPTRLSVHRPVPKPCSVGLCSNALRSCTSRSCLNWAERPRPGTARSASIPPSSSSPFHVYTVCRATPRPTPPLQDVGPSGASGLPAIAFSSHRPTASLAWHASPNNPSEI